MVKLNSPLVKFVVIAFILLIAAGAMVVCYNCKGTETTIASIKLNLPIGTPYNDVEAYLKKIKSEYSYSKETKYFTAILRDVNKKAFTSQSISIVAKMNDQGKLKALDVSVVYTGP
jgi:hypothetical protein